MTHKNYVHDTYFTIYPDSCEVDFMAISEEVNDKISEASKKGWVEISVSMESTMDPYEDYAGPVEITITGRRVPNEHELARQKYDESVNALAKEKDITYYEASILLRLEKEGKL